MKHKKYIVRCSSDEVINIPKEVKNALGWKINEEVNIIGVEMPVSDRVFDAIIIQKVSDTKDIEYQQELKDSFNSGLFDEEAEA